MKGTDTHAFFWWLQIISENSDNAFHNQNEEANDKDKNNTATPCPGKPSVGVPGIDECAERSLPLPRQNISARGEVADRTSSSSSCRRGEKVVLVGGGGVGRRVPPAWKAPTAGGGRREPLQQQRRRRTAPHRAPPRACFPRTLRQIRELIDSIRHLLTRFSIQRKLFLEKLNAVVHELEDFLKVIHPFQQRQCNRVHRFDIGVTALERLLCRLKQFEARDAARRGGGVIPDPRRAMSDGRRGGAFCFFCVRALRIHKAPAALPPAARPLLPNAGKPNRARARGAPAREDAVYKKQSAGAAGRIAQARPRRPPERSAPPRDATRRNATRRAARRDALAPHSNAPRPRDVDRRRHATLNAQDTETRLLRLASRIVNKIVPATAIFSKAHLNNTLVIIKRKWSKVLCARNSKQSHRILLEWIALCEKPKLILASHPLHCLSPFFCIPSFCTESQAGTYKCPRGAGATPPSQRLRTSAGREHGARLFTAHLYLEAFEKLSGQPNARGDTRRSPTIVFLEDANTNLSGLSCEVVGPKREVSLAQARSGRRGAGERSAVPRCGRQPPPSLPPPPPPPAAARSRSVLFRRRRRRRRRGQSQAERRAGERGVSDCEARCAVSWHLVHSVHRFGDVRGECDNVHSASCWRLRARQLRHFVGASRKNTVKDEVAAMERFREISNCRNEYDAAHRMRVDEDDFLRTVEAREPTPPPTTKTTTTIEQTVNGEAGEAARDGTRDAQPG
ncbi:Protein of unknown function [Gryllus bimaculatus]|nr:Protein of unknown function [Gryllus bimaculatus]